MAQQFKFRLDAALRIRHLRTERERARLGELNAQKKRVENMLAALFAERAGASEFVCEAPETGSGDLRALALFSLGLRARAKMLEEAIVDISAQVGQQQQRLLETERDERSILKLRDKRFAEWNVKLMREIEASSQELWLAARTTTMEARSAKNLTECLTPIRQAGESF